MSNRRTTLTLALIAATTLALTACTSSSDDDALPVTTPSAESTQEAEEPTPTPTPTEAQRGTRTNPLAPGEARLVSADSAFTISGGPTTFDAWPAVQAENEFNDPPAAGRQFVMFPLTISVDWPTVAKQAEQNGLDIAAGINPFWSLSAAYVAADGTSYATGDDDYCGVVPNDWSSIQPVFDTATVAGNVCISVPADKITGGTWVVSNTANDAVFIAATA